MSAKTTRVFSTLLTAFAVFGSVRATTWRVNWTNGNDVAAAADATGATRFQTIQAAVAKALANDTILVDPGTYAGPATTNATDGVSRLFIDKALTIESTGTRDDTFIEGAWDVEADPVHGLGPAAIRCVCATAAITIKGFTFRNGATFDETASTERPKSGGGFCGISSSSSKVVDCAFVNCSGTRGGGMRYGYAYRTLFRNCYASKFGAASREAGHAFCVIEGCSGPRICAYIYNVIHCTFMNNTSSDVCIHTDESSKTVRNCVFATGVASVSAKVTLDGCWSWAASVSGTVNANTHLGVFDGLVSPLFGDCHPVKGGVLDGVAADCSAYITAGYRDLDFEGKSVDWTEGMLCPGALQKTVTVASGRIVFANATARLTVDGVQLGSANSSSNYTYATCWPTQYLVAATASADSYEIARLDMYNAAGTSLSARRPPLSLDNTVWITAPPAGESYTYAPLQVSKVYWVSEGADAATANGSKAHPYPNIQDAVSFNAGGGSAGGNRVIKVTRGTYDKGVGASAAYGANNRVEHTNGGFVRIMGVDGAENTFIVGTADSAFDDGCGPAAVRCFASTGNCIVQGFTLTGGHSGAGATESDDSQVTRGGAFVLASDVTKIDSSGAFFTDCIISNNVAWRFAIGYGGRFRRCLFANNRTLREDSALMGAISASCVFRDNISPTGDLRGKFGYSFNCTFVKTDPAYGAAYAQANICNCICYAMAEPTTEPSSIYGTVVDGFGSTASGVTRADPLFRDMAGADLHVATCSPAVGAGSAGAVSIWWQFADSDFEGNRFRFVDGAVVSGAFQTLAPSVNVGVSAGPASGASVDGAAATGVVFFAENEGVTLTANDVATRLFDGFAINGEKVEGSESSATFTYNPAVIPVPGDTLTALYLTNWYVNANSGDDVLKSGASSDDAKKTLAAALAHAVPGDVVHAAEGIYSEGSMLHTEYVYVKDASLSAASPYIRSRAVVPEGVTLIADGSSTNTVILGGRDGTGGDEYGSGPNAVRCVMLEPGAMVKGFTLRGGRTDRENLEDDNNQAGGVLGRSASTCIVDGCVIEDCRSYRGGGGRLVTFKRCRFIGNSAAHIGVAGRECFFFGCFFDGNIGRDVIAYPYRVAGCTFGPGNVTATGGVAQPIGSAATGSAGRRISNTLFCAGGTILGDVFVNCAMPSTAILSANSGDSQLIDCVTTASAAELSLIDANGVPVPGLNPACDGGSLEEWTGVGLDAEFDAAGKARIANAAMDIGCYEADWKSRYSADIGRRGSFTVSAADPYAHEEESGEVRLTGGEIAGTLNVAGSCIFPVRITGSGTLTVTLGGVATAYAGPLASFPLAVAATDGAALSFAYMPGEDDEGGAFIGLGGRLYGAALTIR